MKHNIPFPDFIFLGIFFFNLSPLYHQQVLYKHTIE